MRTLEDETFEDLVWHLAYDVKLHQLEMRGSIGAPFRMSMLRRMVRNVRLDLGVTEASSLASLIRAARRSARHVFGTRKALSC